MVAVSSPAESTTSTRGSGPLNAETVPRRASVLPSTSLTSGGGVPCCRRLQVPRRRRCPIDGVAERDIRLPAQLRHDDDRPSGSRTPIPQWKAISTRCSWTGFMRPASQTRTQTVFEAGPVRGPVVSGSGPRRPPLAAEMDQAGDRQTPHVTWSRPSPPAMTPGWTTRRGHSSTSGAHVAAVVAIGGSGGTACRTRAECALRCPAAGRIPAGARGGDGSRALPGRRSPSTRACGRERADGRVREQRCSRREQAGP